MENKQVFRKSVMDRLSSPEELNEYLHVTRPSVWIALVAVIIILVGALIWSSVTYIESYVDVKAEVKNGTMTVLLDRDTPFLERIEVGQDVITGSTTTQIAGIGYREDGYIATAPSTLADGTYDVKIKFSKTQLLGMIFN